MSNAERVPEQDGNKAPCSGEKSPAESISAISELEEQKKAFAELNDQLLRLAADFENFRRRTARERESITALANERFAVDLLEVVDDFDRALKSDDSHLREGLVQIRQLFSTRLQRHGVTPIDALKKPFNPQEHEAIAHVPSDEPEGIVIDEVSRGYKMNEKIIRHAKVAVSKGNNT
jgi:molecular chaperone GrpE